MITATAAAYTCFLGLAVIKFSNTSIALCAPSEARLNRARIPLDFFLIVRLLCCCSMIVLTGLITNDLSESTEEYRHLGNSRARIEVTRNAWDQFSLWVVVISLSSFYLVVYDNVH